MVKVRTIRWPYQSYQSNVAYRISTGCRQTVINRGKAKCLLYFFALLQMPHWRLHLATGIISECTIQRRFIPGSSVTVIAQYCLTLVTFTLSALTTKSGSQLQSSQTPILCVTELKFSQMSQSCSQLQSYKNSQCVRKKCISFLCIFFNRNSIGRFRFNDTLTCGIVSDNGMRLKLRCTIQLSYTESLLIYPQLQRFLFTLLMVVVLRVRQARGQDIIVVNRKWQNRLMSSLQTRT